jgi:hypothetical protein
MRKLRAQCLADRKVASGIEDAGSLRYLIGRHVVGGIANDAKP